MGVDPGAATVSALTPNVPLRLATPATRLNSRELGFGVFRIRLMVSDDSGNRSTNLAETVVVVERGPDAVAVLRAPPVVPLGREFFWHGGESFTKGFGPVAEYRWTLRGVGLSTTWTTKVAGTGVGGASTTPNDPVPRNLPAGKYTGALEVLDVAGAASAPDRVTFQVVESGGLQAGPLVAVPRFLVNGTPVGAMKAGAAFELDARESFGGGPGGAPRSFLWTWLPFGRATPSLKPFEQFETDAPLSTPPWEPGRGVHRVRLVVTDGRRRQSEPADWVVAVGLG